MAFENSQSQTGTIYGADQSSFGTVEASQNYYQETAPSQLQQSVPGSPYGENYQQSFGASYGRGYGPHVPYKPAPLSQMFLPAQAPQVPQMIYDSPPVSAQPTVKPFMPIAPRELRNANQYQQPTLGSQLYSGTGNPNYQAGPPGGGSLGHIEQVQFLGRRCLGFWLQLLQQGDLCP